MSNYVFFVLAFCAWASAVCPQSQSGLSKFSSNSAWTANGAAVTIPQGTSALLDVSVNLASITVNGKLIFANSNLNVTAGFIFVSGTGSLIIGSTDSGCAITSKIIITLAGPVTTLSDFQMRDSYDATILGSKGIGVATGGTIQIVGSTPALTWTRLSGTAVNGSSQITLQNAPGWSVGDEIVVSSTDYSQTFSWQTQLPSSTSYLMGRGSPDQNERRTITAINGNTITLNMPLNFTHWGAEYEKAEVGLLTRKIVIKGDDASVATQFGGHIMIRKATVALLQGIEVMHFGQRGLLGRYPIHFHTADDVYGLGFAVKDSSIHDCFQRCITVHQTNGVNIQGNVAFNSSGHCYFLEDGSERGNTFDSNLGVLMTAVPNEDPNVLLFSDNRPSVFWITNPNNTWTNNAAVGGTFGYWFSMPLSPTGTSAAKYLANDPWVRPRWTPLGKFDSNVAHSCNQNGIHMDDMVTEPLADTELASYNPLQGPYTDNTYTWNTVRIEAVFSNILSYKNRQYGIWGRGGRFRWTGIVAADNMRGFNSPPEPSVLENSLIIGETDNIGTPQSFEEGRSRPAPWSNDDVIKGWETYDNSGAQFVKSTTFVNFTSNSVRKSGAIGPLECAPFLLQSRDRSINITLQNANPIYIHDCDYGDNGYGWSFYDVDGSLTGSSSWVVSNNALMIEKSCLWMTEWNAYNCPPFKEGGFVQVVLNILNSNGPDYKGLY